MTIEPTVLIAVPESVLNAVEEALDRHQEIVKHRMAVHRDRADRAAWALEHYRQARFDEVLGNVRQHLRNLDGLSPETKASLRDHISRWQEAMPRSKQNAAAWTAHKADMKRRREAVQTRRPRKQKPETHP